ncbi:F-box protein CPR1-like [Pistacia vera]|uniref:F-box protein CPR1-like n=1 Tax=Pistacia vera TaxID=55513 RepID=UPI0012638242|nr:F-box protein CPR1-like [Pistacia vera]XP_031277859.1 F-box protein CPR1-like [Pistacia vera]
MSSLPSDIIADILSRLPAKKLLCVKCVCKPWCHLIDGPDFIKLHLEKSMKSNTNQSLILKHSHLYWVSLDSLESASEIDHPLMCYNHSVKLLGSCHGLLCISNIVDDMAFWNPSTRKHRVLPFMSLELRRYTGSSVCSVCVFGFGYDITNDDYKLVRVAQFRGTEISFVECEVKVFSLRRNSWKRIKDMPYACRYPGTNGVYACGALHWIVSRNCSSGDFHRNGNSGDFNVVVALDLAAEDYKEVALPEFGSKNFNLDVGALGGCLCVVANFSNVRSDVWVMKEYGVKDSWDKLLSVTREQMCGIGRSVRPLGYSKGGSEVLLEQDRINLFWYDLKKKTVKDVVIHGTPISYEVEICLQTLVSVNISKRDLGKNQGTADHDKNVKKRDDFLSEGFKLVL